MEQKPGEYARIVVSREEYEQFKSQQARISELEQQVTALREALRLAQHKRFGASSEKTVDDGSQQLSFLFNEAEVIADQEAAQDKQETLVAAHKRHKKHEYTLDNLPDGVATEVVEHRVPQEELECPICGETMQEIGKEVVRKLKIIPAQVIVVEHRYYAYACRNCDQNDIETPVTTAEREKSVIRGSFATAEALAHIMVQKFVMGSPLYRQEQEMKRQGIPLSRQTIFANDIAPARLKHFHRRVFQDISIAYDRFGRSGSQRDLHSFQDQCCPYRGKSIHGGRSSHDHIRQTMLKAHMLAQIVDDP